jgi:hypothetical protein
MAGYQWAHTQTYSRAGTSQSFSVRDILAEMERQPHASSHVDQPEANLLLGMQPGEAADEIDRRAREQRRAWRGQIGKGQGISKQTHVMEAAVASFPHPTRDVKDGSVSWDDYYAWRDDALEFLKRDMESRGLEVLTAVEHLDENHPHIHVAAIPRADTDWRLNAKHTHPGHSAKLMAQAAGFEKPNYEYCQAMVEWQDKYNKAVAEPHAQSRKGPGRRRLTRQAYLAEQAALQANARSERRAQRAQAIIEDAQQRAQYITDVADAYAGTRFDDADAVVRMADDVLLIARQAQDAAENREAKAAEVQHQAEAEREAAAEDRRQAEAERQEAQAAQARAHALETGVQAWMDGKITDARLNDHGNQVIEYCDRATCDEIEPQIKPARERVWRWIKETADKMKKKIDAITKRESDVAKREQDVQQLEYKVDNYKKYIEKRERTVQQREHELVNRESSLSKRENTISEKRDARASSRPSPEKRQEVINHFMDYWNIDPNSLAPHLRPTRDTPDDASAEDDDQPGRDGPGF